MRGGVIVKRAAQPSPRFSIGTLVITNTLTLGANSTNLMELDATAHTNDLITGLASVELWRTIDRHVNPAVHSRRAMASNCFTQVVTVAHLPASTLPTLTGNLIWTNRLAH